MSCCGEVVVVERSKEENIWPVHRDEIKVAVVTTWQFNNGGSTVLTTTTVHAIVCRKEEETTD